MCSVQGQDQKNEQKHTIKNFVRFHNYSLLLTMLCEQLRVHLNQSLTFFGLYDQLQKTIFVCVEVQKGSLG